MDIGTVKSQLLAGKYRTYEELFNDIQLIWDNCKLYNAAGSPITRICEIMEKIAKSKIAKFRTAHGLPTPSNVLNQASTRTKRQSSKNAPERSSSQQAKPGEYDK
jgi:hypothetical protein